MKRGTTQGKAQAPGRSLDPIVRQLIKAYDDYLALLKMEADSMISVAFVHGWRSCFFEEGKAHRAKIEELKFALDYEKQDRLAKFAHECRRNAGLGDSQPNAPAEARRSRSLQPDVGMGVCDAKL